MRHWALPHSTAWAATVCLLLAAGPVAGQEVFVLKGGGQLAGTWLRDDDLPRQQIHIETPLGLVALDRGEIRQRRNVRREEEEYERVRPDYPDTPEGQWALAEWCAEHRLHTQREQHLMRVIELDPDHEDARRALDHTKVDGRWTTEDEIMRERGYQRYRGRWRLPQEIEILERHQARETAEAEWFAKVNRWRNWLGGDRTHEARALLASIDDPLAVRALARALADESRYQVRLLLMESLARIGTPAALQDLAVRATADPIEDVRLAAIEHLSKTPHPDITGYFVARLRDRDNRVVNRAAVALGRLNDPAAVPALIHALITSHTFQVNPNAGQMSVGFGSGGTGLSTGGGPRNVSVQRSNAAVLDALTAITGMRFGFDQRAWQTWYASSQRSESIDLRRN